MARPRKDDCDYFPHVVGMLQDPKVRFAVNDSGAIAYAVYCAVLEAVFSNAFFIPTTAEAFEIIPVDLRMTQGEFDEIMEVLINRKLVENSLYRDGVVTSAGMVKQYFQIKKRTTIPPEWVFLIEKLGLSPEKLGLCDEQTPQSKLKKSKENKRNETQVSEAKKSGSGDADAEGSAPPPRCPQCGGRMRFDPKGPFWRCRSFSCRATVKPYEIGGAS